MFKVFFLFGARFVNFGDHKPHTQTMSCSNRISFPIHELPKSVIEIYTVNGTTQQQFQHSTLDIRQLEYPYRMCRCLKCAYQIGSLGCAHSRTLNRTQARSLCIETRTWCMPLYGEGMRTKHKAQTTQIRCKETYYIS